MAGAASITIAGWAVYKWLVRRWRDQQLASQISKQLVRNATKRFASRDKREMGDETTSPEILLPPRSEDKSTQHETKPTIEAPSGRPDQTVHDVGRRPPPVPRKPDESCNRAIRLPTPSEQRSFPTDRTPDATASLAEIGLHQLRTLLGTLSPADQTGSPAGNDLGDESNTATANGVSTHSPDRSEQPANQPTNPSADAILADAAVQIVEDNPKEMEPDDGGSLDTVSDVPIVEFGLDERPPPEGSIEASDDHAEISVPSVNDSPSDRDEAPSASILTIDQSLASPEPAEDGSPDSEIPSADAPSAEIEPSNVHTQPSASTDNDGQPALAPAIQKPTVFRDRRGARRAAVGQTSQASKPEQNASVGTRQAEAKFRLTIDPIRRSIILSIVLSRPEGFPEIINVDSASEPTQAFDQASPDRYDDIEVIWTPGLLDGELRQRDEGQHLEWLRSARRVHIFAAIAGEPDLLTVSAAQSGKEHAIACREGDIEPIEAIAIQAGSPSLQRYPNYHGVPAGWAVLGGYVPACALSTQPEVGFRPLDPGAEIAIVFAEGFEIRNAAFAHGHPPRVLIERMPSNCEVRIGGGRAAISDDGSWQAPGWDKPGKHLVDVTPGPSQSYEIVADPAHGSGWETWNANSDLIPALVSNAAICGAQVLCSPKRVVLAVEPASDVLALGARRHVQRLYLRPDKLAAVGILPFAPAFLIVSSGRRRTEGKIVSLGNPEIVNGPNREPVDLPWVAAVRNAAARRLPVHPTTAAAKTAWGSATNAARRWRGGR